MTARGRAVLALGVVCWIVAIVFGSPALYPVAAGLVIVVPLAVAWVRITLRQPRVGRRWKHENLVERDDVRIELVLEREPGLPLPNVMAHEQLGRVGDEEVELRSRGRRGATRAPTFSATCRADVTALRLCACRSPIRSGSPRRAWPLDEQQALVVYPRLVELDRLFFDGGAGAEHGRRLLLRRPVGFELHSVRDYQQGESLRRVHWPSTARRGALMVKELEDSPRDEVAVLLDGDPAAVTGSSPDSSFDVAVGSPARSSSRRCSAAAAACSSSTPLGARCRPVSSDGPEWQRALELLAGGGARRRADRPRACSGRLTAPPRARSSSSS